MFAAARWPTAVDYQTALQTPALCFNDLALKQGTVLTDPLGLPLAATGNVVVVETERRRLKRGLVVYSSRPAYSSGHRPWAYRGVAHPVHHP